MSIHGGTGRGKDWRVEASGGELKHGIDLFLREVELLDDFVYAGTNKGRF